ncbi:hypothetical protein PR048_030090 [Dryococelus australis]|uniref:Uncharacterized protein n=1 Tax=Dryococelus australis TaxID=614101 RepID=A0ABQ9G7Y8_9NEOP|nr:hypothetical protein PR048_030090 [Dryococelus australis]
MRVIEVNTERRRNDGAGETENSRENPPTNGIVRHDSHLRKSGDPEKAHQPTASSGTIPTCENPVTRPGIEPSSPWWETSVLIAQPPRPQEVMMS